MHSILLNLIKIFPIPPSASIKIPPLLFVESNRPSTVNPSPITSFEF
jgi:hypothetical protein